MEELELGVGTTAIFVTLDFFQGTAFREWMGTMNIPPHTEERHSFRGFRDSENRAGAGVAH